MIPKVHRSSNMTRLMRYLAGPGKANEHTNQRVLAGDLVTMAVYAGRVDTARAVEIARLLDSPRQTLRRGEPVQAVSHTKARALLAEGHSHAEAYAAATSDENTWHCSLSLHRDEGQLSDETWAAIARDFMAHMGFADREDEIPDARWVAVHHGQSTNGNDHIHIAAAAVRPDGSTLDTYRDFARAHAAARVLEHKYGLRVLHSREEGGTELGTGQAERARAERVGAPETDREALRRRVRGAAMAADSEAEWLRLLRAEGVIVSPRWAEGGVETVTGYSVRLPAQKNRTTGATEKSIAYGGLRLGKDMTLPSLRSWAGWAQGPHAHQEALAEWQRIGRGPSGRPRAVDPMSAREAVEELRQWSAAMRRIPVTDRNAWAQAASQTAGVFAAASVRTERSPGPLDKLSRQLARAGQMPAHRREPGPANESGPLRAVARMLWAAANPGAMVQALLSALTDLLLTIRSTLEMTQRAAAATAMASQARRALTEIHMRADGIDPTRPYRKEEGAPAWAAAVRASVAVDGLDRTEHEARIADARTAWDARRVSARGFSDGQCYDANGQILDDVDLSAAAAGSTGRARRDSVLRDVRAGIDEGLQSPEGPAPTPPARSTRPPSSAPDRWQPAPPQPGPERDRDGGVER